MVVPVYLIVTHEDLLEAGQVVEVGHGADQVPPQVELHQAVQAPQARHVTQHVARQVQQPQLLQGSTRVTRGAKAVQGTPQVLDMVG